MHSEDARRKRDPAGDEALATAGKGVSHPGGWAGRGRGGARARGSAQRESGARPAPAAPAPVPFSLQRPGPGFGALSGRRRWAGCRDLGAGLTHGRSQVSQGGGAREPRERTPLLEVSGGARGWRGAQ